MLKKIIALVSVIALLIVLVPVGAFAASDTTNVQGTFGTTYSVYAPEDINLATLDYQATTSSTPQTLSVETNDTTKTTVNIDVMDATGNLGYMTSGSGSLSSRLKLSGTDLATIDLSESNQALKEGAMLAGTDVLTWSVSDLVIEQPPFDMAVPDTYATTITFTATFLP